MTDKDLQYALDAGIINVTSIQSIIEMTRRKELLNKHPYKIWNGTDGKWHTYLPDEKKGRIPRKKNTKEEIEDVVIEYWRTVEENPMIEELFTEWNTSQVEKGFIKYNTALRNESIFKRHFEELKFKRIKDMYIDVWVEFLETEIAKHRLTAKSFSGLKAVVKGIIRLAKRKKLISYNIQDIETELMIPKNGFYRTRKKDSEEVYNIDETALILNYCRENPDIWSQCISLIFVTGLRCGEAVALKHDDLDPNHVSVDVHATESRTKDEKGIVRTFVQDFPKTEAGARVIAIPKQFQYLINDLWERSKTTEYVFEHNGKRVHSNAIRKKLARICEKLNIPYKSPHKIRKTYCSILFDNNLSSSFIINQMGHTSITTSEIFYHKNRNPIDEKVELVSQIDEFNLAVSNS